MEYKIIYGFCSEKWEKENHHTRLKSLDLLSAELEFCARDVHATHGGHPFCAGCPSCVVIHAWNISNLVKLDTWCSLRNSPLHHSALFPKAEEDITKSEADSRLPHKPGSGSGRGGRNSRGYKPYQTNWPRHKDGKKNK